MSRTKMIVLASFLTAFVAGVALGIAVGEPGKARSRGSWLVNKLGLTADQHEKMRAVWGDCRSKADATDYHGQRAELRH